MLLCAKHNIFSKDVTNQKLTRYQKWFILSKNMMLKIEHVYPWLLIKGQYYECQINVTISWPTCSQKEKHLTYIDIVISIYYYIIISF